MKVFISWSGELSNNLAEEFRTWLPGALQSVKPYFTPSDIEKGARWNTEISKELEASDVGVLFITRQNLNSAWLLYEAGALSKKLEKSRVCPIVFGLSPNDLPGPLRQFQVTEFKKDDFRKLLKTINASAGDGKLEDSVLGQVFEMWWPRLEDRFKEILDNEQEVNDEEPLRPDREILEEILELSRLSARRVARANRIHPEAIADLISSIKSAYEAIQGVPDPGSALEALSEMRKPISYLADKAGAHAEVDLRMLIKELDELTFEYEDPDDEIPF